MQKIIDVDVQDLIDYTYAVKVLNSGEGEPADYLGQIQVRVSFDNGKELLFQNDNNLNLTLASDSASGGDSTWATDEEKDSARDIAQTQFIQYLNTPENREFFWLDDDDLGVVAENKTPKKRELYT